MNIRFYDNEETNWENDMVIFNAQMEFIHVNEYEPNLLVASESAPQIDKTSSETKLRTISERNRIFISAYIDYWSAENNTYAKYLQEMIVTNLTARNEILKQDAWEGVLRIGYPNNGLNIEDLLVWSSSNNGKKIVLSDWDRTITIVEGMYFGPTDGVLTQKVETGEISLEDLLVYLMGDKDRLEKVTNMFKTLDGNGVPIYILTHNRNASKNNWPQNRQLYIKILQQLMPFRSAEEIDRMLFSSADYKLLNSIKDGDVENSYRKYKSTCAIDLIKDVLLECKKYDLVIGGKGGKKRKTRTTKRRNKKNKRMTKRGKKR